MSGNFEVRREVLQPGWNDEEPACTQVEDPFAYPDLCQNCTCILQELAKHVVKIGDETFKTETTSVQLARFSEDQLMKTQDCCFCRVIQSCNPGRFVDDGVYPKLAYLSKRSDWGMDDLWRIEFALTSVIPSPVGNLYMLAVPDVPSSMKEITSWVSNGDTLDCAQIWLNDCIQNHDCVTSDLANCCDITTLSYQFHPTRLISIGSNSDSPIRLVLRTDIPQSSKYATLSHCWGDYKPIQLLSSNLASFLTSIDFSSLSKTFQDAITTARHLGIQYIWIDSLCIVQDSDADWSSESLHMNHVYSNSHLNIAAAAATDGRGGLFFPKTVHHDEDMRSTYTIGNKQFRIIDRDHSHNSIEALPLFTRAWVYQERLLTQRNIYFLKNSIAWECKNRKLSETFPVKMPSLENGHFEKQWIPNNSICTSLEEQRTKNKVLYRHWTQKVSAYTSCNLTYRTDKLIALSGIASKFHQMLLDQRIRDTYISGLWKNDITNQLLWYVNDGSKSLDRREEVFVAPTWSWASITGPVEFHSHHIPRGEFIHTTKNLTIPVNTNHDPNNPFGKQEPGSFITLATQICKASLVYRTEQDRCGCCGPNNYNAYITYFSGSEFATTESPARFHPDYSFEGRERGYGVDDLYCIPLVEDVFVFGEKRSWTWVTGLVLVKSEGEEGAFERWGSWKISFQNVIGGLGGLKGAFEGFDGEGLGLARKSRGLHGLAESELNGSGESDLSFEDGKNFYEIKIV